MGTPLFPELVVNGERIAHSVVAAEAQNHEAPRGKPGIAWRKAADAVATRALLVQEAHRQGINAEPAELGRGRRETTEDALIRALLDKELTVSRPSEADIRAEYDKNPDRFRTPPLWEVSHILFACDPHDSAESEIAHRRAMAVCEDLTESPGSFAAIARQYSQCQSAASGGSLGQICPGDTVPEFEGVIRGLAEGQVASEPVQSRHGWHIVRLDGLAQGKILPFGAVRDRIAEAMEKAAWVLQARNFVAKLVENAQIQGSDLSAASRV